MHSWVCTHCTPLSSLARSDFACHAAVASNTVAAAPDKKVGRLHKAVPRWDPRRGSCVRPRRSSFAPMSNTACFARDHSDAHRYVAPQQQRRYPRGGGPSSSPCRATRLRLRQFICRTGSMPTCRSSNPLSNGEPSGRSFGLSVTWIASTKSLRRRARAIQGRRIGRRCQLGRHRRAMSSGRRPAGRSSQPERERGRRQFVVRAKRRAGPGRQARCLRGRGWRPRHENTGGPSTMCHKCKGR